MSVPAVEMTGITKRYGGVAANDGASLRVEKGAIHAVVGENGAGKSTLMKILYGLCRPDAGRIMIDGQEAVFSSPRDAIARGIGMVHQHFMLAAALTVAENAVLGAEPSRGLSFDSKKAEQLVRELSSRYGLALDPRAKAETLSVGEQQRLEILKVLCRGADILVLDEPTAVLAPRETAAFFGILSRLRSEGKTAILITHKLREVKAIADDVTVMRRGKTAGFAKAADIDEAGLAGMMLGRAASLKIERRVKSPEELIASKTALCVDNVHALSARGAQALRGVSFEIKEGEVFGIAGVEGNGQTELAEVLCGLRRPTEGRICVCGADACSCAPSEMSGLGMAHMPEDRRRRGLVLDYTMRENMVLGLHRQERFNRLFAMDSAAVCGFADGLAEKFGVYPLRGDIKACALSGGNQQKLVAARELSRKPRVLIAAQPTRGVDIGAVEFIHKKIIEARDEGTAVLLLSSDISELLALSDRIGVMYRGVLAGIFHAAEADENKIGLLMAGGKK